MSQPTALAMLSVDPNLIPAPTWEERLVTLHVLFFGYVVVMLGLSIWHVARSARHGLWRPGALGDLRSADVAILVLGLLGTMVLFVAVVGKGAAGWTNPIWVPILGSAVGLALATPFAVRTLGRVVRQLVIYAVNLSFTAAVLWAVSRLWPIADPAVRPALQLAAVFVPVLLPEPLPAAAPVPLTGFKESKQRVIEQFERRFITEALARHHGNISKAAEEMGMYRQHLQLKLAECGIDASRFKE